MILEQVPTEWFMERIGKSYGLIADELSFQFHIAVYEQQVRNEIIRRGIRKPTTPLESKQKRKQPKLRPFEKRLIRLQNEVGKLLTRPDGVHRSNEKTRKKTINKRQVGGGY